MREHGGKVGARTLSEPAWDEATPTPGRQSLVQLSAGSAFALASRSPDPEPPQAEPVELPSTMSQLPSYGAIRGLFGRTVQAKAGAARGAPDVHAAAAEGIAGPSGPLPHLAQIQRSFGRHDIRHIQAHQDDRATAGATAMGAQGFATGDHVAFAGTPSLHTAAHEAAHVVQQRGGVHLAGGIGQTGDAYEQHADHVADAVVRGESAEALLDRHAGGGAGHAGAEPGACPTCGGAAKSGSCQRCGAQTASVQRQVLSNPAGGGPACHGTNRTSSPEHTAIQAHYTATIDPTGVREYAIPGGSSGGNVGYADIASVGTGAIYEIKPYIPSEITAGATQVAAYVAAAILSCGAPPPWHVGVTYPDSVIPFGVDQELVTKQYNHPGLILYYTRRKQTRPQPVPVPAPQDQRQRDRQRQAPQTRPAPNPLPSYQQVLDVVIVLGLSIAMVPVILAALADPEPASKLALAGLSVAMIGVLLEKLGMEESPGPQA